MKKTLDEMLWEMGFTPTDVGPNVTELRKVTERQTQNGLIGRSAGTWAPEHGPAGMKLPAEERAAAFLKLERAIAAGRFTEMAPLGDSRS